MVRLNVPVCGFLASEIFSIQFLNFLWFSQFLLFLVFSLSGWRCQVAAKSLPP